MNPYPLIDVFDASKIPPVNAQELLESFRAWLENFVRGKCQFVELFNFEKWGKYIFATFPNSFFVYCNSIVRSDRNYCWVSKSLTAVGVSKGVSQANHFCR